MFERTAFFSTKRLILGFLILLFPLFQNMSSIDSFDIREKAPAKPDGFWENPIAAYFPESTAVSNLSGLQQNILSHNFDPLLKDWESRFLKTQNHSFKASVLNDSAVSEKETHLWQLGWIQPTKMRLSYQGVLGIPNLRLSCENMQGSNGLKLSMVRPFSNRMNLEVSHETGPRQSQVQMDFRW
jgi:hypothetical protein